MIPIAFGQGLETKLDPKRVQAGKLLELENGVFDKGARLSKRHGYDALSNQIEGGGVLTSSQGLTVFNEELLQFANNHLYSWSSQSNAWIDKGACFAVKNNSSNVIRNTFNQRNADLAINQNLACVVYEDSQDGGAHVTVIDQSTGAYVQSNVPLNTSGRVPRVVSVGNQFMILYSVASNLNLRIINIGLPSILGPEVTLQNDIHSTTPLIDIVQADRNVIFTYLTTGTTLKTSYLTENGVLGSVAIGLPNPLATASDGSSGIGLAWEPQTGRILLAWANQTTGIWYTLLNADFTAVVAVTQYFVAAPPFAVRLSPYFKDASNFGFFYELANTNPYDHLILKAFGNVAGGLADPVILNMTTGLASKVFQVDGVHFVIAIHDSNYQATYFAIDENGVIHSKALYSQASGLPTKPLVGSAYVDTHGKLSFAAGVKNAFVSENKATTFLNGISLETMAFNSPDRINTAVISNNLLIGGGMIQAYDGANLTELGFNFFPEGLTASTSVTGGPLGRAVYQYFLVYAWIDAQGQTHRSSPSLALSLDFSASSTETNAVTLSLPTLKMTRKTNVVIEVYRTLGNQIVPYKVTTYANPVYNNPAVDYISWSDTTSDGNLQGNEILYTAGNVLENDAPPAGNLIDISNNRAIIAGSDDPLTFYYSKQSSSGFGLSFSANFSYRVDPRGGPITALKYMDNNIVIFKKTAIFYVAGHGPDDTGANNDFSEPVLVSNDVGCINPKSCVLAPQGLMFMSTKGIYMLNRGMLLEYVGAGAEAYNHLTIVDSNLLNDTNQVRFLTDSGVTLTFDYFFGQWGIFTNHGGTGSAIWKNVYAYARDNGQVYVENKDRFDDNGFAYTLKIKTAWIKLLGLQNFQRVRGANILGDYLTPHTLKVSVAYDYQPFFTDYYYFNATQVIAAQPFGADNPFGAGQFGGGVAPCYQFRVGLSRQKCEAIQFQFEDVQTNSMGAAYALSDMSLEVGLKQGFNKMQRAQTVSSS